MAAKRARFALRTKCLLALAPVVALTVALGAQGTRQGRELPERVKARDWNVARTLITQGTDVNVPLADGTTALHWAAHWDEGEIATLLIQAGAKPNLADSNGVRCRPHDGALAWARCKVAELRVSVGEGHC